MASETTSIPWRPRRDCPPAPPRPKIRSFRIGSRPFQERERETEALLAIAEACQAVLPPTVGA